MTNHVTCRVQAGVFQPMGTINMQFYGPQRQAHMQVVQHMAITVLSHMQDLMPIYRAFVARLAPALGVK
ncbi:hypothetical protein [Alcaligenes faecalis]|uniref:hypothetical protein n=1 Tax=Alcaligenes faecalis TaxID=511 RepID=UPI001D179378|nr:hypothetical protein [Alcaligenes faecalis]